MSDGVCILGGFQTDFARHLTREGKTIGALVEETARGALEAAELDPVDVGTIHVGNAFGELFTGQAHLGAMPASVLPALWGVPAMRHEGACASGSLAILSAMAEIEAGRYDVALVLGVEIERNVSGEIAARHMGSAAHVGEEAKDARYVWPRMFSDVADEVERVHGLDRRHLAAIAKKNLSNARANPRAQTRAWTFADAAFGEDDVANPIVEGRLRRLDCAQVTDGGAGVVLASRRFAEREWKARHGARAPRIAGWGHRTAGLSLAAKFERRARPGVDAFGDPLPPSPFLMPHLRRTIEDAYRRAGIDGPLDLAGIEAHDCFTITEYLAIDHLGITEPGRASRAIEERVTERDGRVPVNPSGGLIGGGHPVGATGVRMLLDAANQVRDRAGDTQIRLERGRRRFATLNIGGSTATSVCFVVEA
ncbi:MAG: acetyl-CoA acetyltransferase [Polyangiaceae bacterium]